MVLEYLNSVRQEAYDNLCALDLTAPAEDVKTKTAIYVTQSKLSFALLQLPQVIKALEDQEFQQQKKKLNFADSQEGGKL